MKGRIAIWASAGALVVVCWTLYVSMISPIPPDGPAWTLVYSLCPIALARHYALSFFSVLLANVATYSLVGLAVETTRRLFHPRPIAN